LKPPLVPEVGVEQPQFSQAKTASDENGGHPGGQFRSDFDGDLKNGSREGSVDLDLQALIAAWSNLNGETKDLILQVLRR
jgi:hypothetical protein